WAGKLSAKSIPPTRQSAECIALNVESLALRLTTVAFFFMSSLLFVSLHSSLDTRPFSFYDSVRKHQHVRRYSHTDLLGGLKIDYQLKLRGQLHRKLTRFCSFEDLVYNICRPPGLLSLVCAIGHQTSDISELWSPKNPGKALF